MSEADLIAAQEALQDAQDAMNDAIRDRDAAIRNARADGASVASIVRALGIDRQTVYRIIRRDARH